MFAHICICVFAHISHFWGLHIHAQFQGHHRDVAMDNEKEECICILKRTYIMSSSERDWHVKILTENNYSLEKTAFCRDELKQEMNEWLRQYIRYFCSPQILKKRLWKKCITITIGCHGHSQINQDILLCWHFQKSLFETLFCEKSRKSLFWESNFRRI